MGIDLNLRTNTPLTIMKQSELDRELRLLVKAESEARRWKSIGSTPYRSSGPFFFCITMSARAKEGSFHAQLRFKWLELDHLLWRVLGMSSNEHEPFSFHANGAFVLTGWEIQSSVVRGIAWQPSVLAQQVQVVAQQAADRATVVALELDSVDEYVRFLERQYEAFMQMHPRAKVTIWKELLLASMLREDKRPAVDIAKDRISKHDSGEFSSGGKTFFERALASNDA